VYDNVGSVAQLRLDVQPSLHGPHALAHVDKPKSEMVSTDPFKVETDSPVANGQGNLLLVAGQFYLHSRRVRMLRHIGQTLLHDPVETGRDVPWQGAGTLFLHQDGLDSRLMREVVRQVFERGKQTQVVKNRRVKPVGHATDIVRNGRKPLCQRLKTQPRMVERGRRMCFHAAQFNRQQCQALIDVVMKFPLNSPAFLVLSRHELGGQRLQLLLGPQAVSQISEDERKSGFVGDRQCGDAGLGWKLRSIFLHPEDIPSLRCLS